MKSAFCTAYALSLVRRRHWNLTATSWSRRFQISSFSNIVFRAISSRGKPLVEPGTDIVHVPGQQLVNAVYRVVGDALDDVAQVGLRGRDRSPSPFRSGCRSRPRVAAGVRSSKGPVAPADRDRSHGTLGGRVVDAGAAVAQDQRQRLPARQAVADGLGQFAATGDAGAASPPARRAARPSAVPVLRRGTAGAARASGRGCRVSIL